MRRAIGPALLGASLVQCFAVPERGCEDESGLYVAYHVCMPSAGFELGVQKLILDLKRADFDGEGIANDLAGLAYIVDPANPENTQASAAIVRVRRQLGAPQQEELTVPVGTVDVTPVHLGSSQQSLAYVIDDSFGAAAGKIELRINSNGVFTEPVTGGLDNLLLQGCRAPSDVTTLSDEPVVLVTCEREDAPDEPVAFGRADIGAVYLVPFVESGGKGLYFYGLEDDEVDGVHGTQLFDGDGEADGPLFGAAISKPTAGDGATAQNLEHDKIMIVQLKEAEDMLGMDKPDMAPMATVRLEDGPIEDLYAGQLDGEGTIELISRHQDRGYLRILQQRELGSLSFAVVGEALEVSQPLDVAVGDFTGDGAVDIAVAYAEADVAKLGVFIRAPDSDAFAFGFAEMGGVGERELATAIEALDVDDDGALDLAIAVATEDVGTEIRVFLNRAAGPR